MSLPNGLRGTLQEEPLQWPIGVRRGGAGEVEEATQPAVTSEIKRWVEWQYPSERALLLCVCVCVFVLDVVLQSVRSRYCATTEKQSESDILLFYLCVFLHNLKLNQNHTDSVFLFSRRHHPGPCRISKRASVSNTHKKEVLSKFSDWHLFIRQRLSEGTAASGRHSSTDIISRQGGGWWWGWGAAP